MAKEQQDYRENLRLLRETFPGRLALSLKEVCTVLGCDRRALLKDAAFPARKISGQYSISITSLARYMS